MLRRSMILIMSLVLFGALALSAPTLGAQDQQAGKAAITTVKGAVVKTTTSATAITTKSTSVSVGWKNGLRFYLRNWFGWPYIQVLDPKPPVPDGPQKSNIDPRSRWLETEKTRDNGGHPEDS